MQSEISSQLEEKSVEEKSALEQSIVLSETTPFYMPKDLQVCTRKLVTVSVCKVQLSEKATKISSYLPLDSMFTTLISLINVGPRLTDFE